MSYAVTPQYRHSTHTSRLPFHHMTKGLLILLAVVLVLLQYRFWFGDGGLTELWQLQRTIEEQQQEITVLRERNQALEAEVVNLREGLDAIEERARSDLGMIKEDETFYQAITPPGQEEPDKGP